MSPVLWWILFVILVCFLVFIPAYCLYQFINDYCKKKPEDKLKEYEFYRNETASDHSLVTVPETTINRESVNRLSDNSNTLSSVSSSTLVQLNPVYQSSDLNEQNPFFESDDLSDEDLDESNPFRDDNLDSSNPFYASNDRLENSNPYFVSISDGLDLTNPFNETQNDNTVCERTIFTKSNGISKSVDDLEYCDPKGIDVLRCINRIEEYARKTEEEGQCFRGPTKNITFFEINEKFIRCMISLSEVQCETEELRRKKMETFSYIERCQDDLKSRLGYIGEAN